MGVRYLHCSPAEAGMGRVAVLGAQQVQRCRKGNYFLLVSQWQSSSSDASVLITPSWENSEAVAEET